MRPTGCCTRPVLLWEDSNGPRAILCATLHMVAHRGLFPGPDIWLLLRNPITNKLMCYLSNTPAGRLPTGTVSISLILVPDAQTTTGPYNGVVMPTKEDPSLWISS